MALRRLRERKFLNQSQLATALGVRQKTVSDWERGTARPRTAHMQRLCAVLDVTPDELLKALDEPGKPPPTRDSEQVTAHTGEGERGATPDPVRA